MLSIFLYSDVTILPLSQCFLSSRVWTRFIISAIDQRCELMCQTSSLYRAVSLFATGSVRVWTISRDAQRKRSSFQSTNEMLAEMDPVSALSAGVGKNKRMDVLSIECPKRSG